MTKTVRTLLYVGLGLIALILFLPYKVGWDAWSTSNSAGMGLIKLVELVALIALFSVVAAIGGIKITESDKSHMEWFGSALVFLGGLVVGVFFFLKGMSPDEFNEYRYLVSQRPTRSVAIEPEMKMDWDTGKLKFKVDEAHLWIAINIDYYNNDPLPRKSMVLYNYQKDSEGFGEVDIPSHENVSRVGVFYATSVGPSGDCFEKDPTPPEEPAVTPTTVVPPTPTPVPDPST